MADDELPATAYAVLGILSLNDEELTAGEIKTRAGFGMRHFYWSPAISHIRRELRRLLDMGLVEEREITNGQVRRSLVYQTTAAGEEALARWVTGSAESMAQEPDRTAELTAARIPSLVVHGRRDRRPWRLKAS